MDILGFVIVPALIYCVVTLYKYYKTQQKIHKYLDKFPGDPYWPIIGSVWRFLWVKREDVHECLKETFKEFGPTWRLYAGEIPMLLISKVEHMEVIFKDTVNINKGEGYRFVVPWLGNGLITAGGHLWKNNRRLINPAFHFNILDKYSEVFSAKAEELADIFEHKSGNEYIDIFPYIIRWGLDVIAETAMGIKFDCLKNPDLEYANAIFKLCKLFTIRSRSPWLQNDFIFNNFSKEGKLFQKYVKLVKGTNMRIIAERRAEYKKGKGHTKVDDLGRKEKLALLDTLLQNQEGNNLTDEEICDEVSTFMFAGQDTTASTVTFAMLAIGSDSGIQSKVHKELDNIFRNDQRSVTPQNIADMEYLERVVKESLRMFAVVPQVGRKLNKDIVLDGKVVPAGANIQLCLNQMHHQPEHWPKPEIFDPDRFLPENSVNRHPYAFSPFSGGIRNCIGQKFGTRNAKTVLATVLRKFKIQSLETVQNLKLYEEVVLRPQRGPYISFRLRNKIFS